MTHDPLDLLWQSPANHPDRAAGPQLAAAFVAQAQRRRRRQAWWLGWTTLALAAITALAGWQSVRMGVGAPGVALSWSLLALPWMATLHFWRGFRRERAVPAGVVLPLAQALVVAEDINRTERRRLVLIGALLVLMLPLSAWAAWSLHVEGKAAAHEAWSMATVFAVGLGAGLTAVVLRHRRLTRQRDGIAAQRTELDRPNAD